MKHLIPAVARSIGKFPLKTMVGAILLSYLIVHNDPFEVSYGMTAERLKEAEFFPLSSFPMYSTFSDRPYLVYLTDENDEGLATFRHLDVRTSSLKKAYEGELKLIKKETGTPIREMTAAQKEGAGAKVLKMLVEEVSPNMAAQLEIAELRLWEVILTRTGSKIHTSNMYITKIPLNRAKKSL